MHLPAVIRDPVHDIISFEDEPQDRLLLGLINTREFQRLRRIKQLGMAELVFPAANHSRFAHSIGVMHNARRFTKAVVAAGAKLTELQQTAVVAAALLHDVGHGPFSHAFEKVTGDKHEGRTLDIIRTPATEVHQALLAYSKELPDLIVNFFDKDRSEEEREAKGIPAYATQIVDGQLDADRSDYLLRDSHATGTDYGRFDLNWLIRQLRFDGKKVYVGRKGLGAVEQFVYARFHMFGFCYYHKTIRSAEVMLRLVFQRFREMVRGKDVADVVKLFPGVQPALLAAFVGDGGNEKQRIKLADYLELDDGSVVEFFKVCTGVEDVTLQYLAQGLLNRRLYKAVDLTGIDGAKLMALGKEVYAAIGKAQNRPPAGFDDEFVWIEDTASDTPYKPYKPGKPQDQIQVEGPGGTVEELTVVSEPVKALSKYSLLRYLYPAELRDTIEPVIKGILNGGK